MDKLKLESNTDSSLRAVTQSALGAAFPVAIWKSDVLSLTWHVRWAAAGLTAIKPVILFSQEFNVESGKAIELTGP